MRLKHRLIYVVIIFSYAFWHLSAVLCFSSTTICQSDQLFLYDRIEWLQERDTSDWYCLLSSLQINLFVTLFGMMQSAQRFSPGDFSLDPLFICIITSHTKWQQWEGKTEREREIGTSDICNDFSLYIWIYFMHNRFQLSQMCIKLTVYIEEALKRTEGIGGREREGFM